jgi:hypothetical protein
MQFTSPQSRENPKFEIRNPKQIQNPELKTRSSSHRARGSVLVIAISAIRACFGFRISNFLSVACTLVLLPAGTLNAAIATLDDLVLEPESYWNGDDGSGGFVSGKAYFANQYDLEWDFWDGFAYSNITDANSMGYLAQFNSITGSGQGDSPNYAVAYVGWETLPTVTFETPQPLGGLYVTNNRYAYYDMLYGSPYSKKFGGDTGDDEDWFMLTIIGLDADGEIAGEVDFYLADFRFEDNAQDYILDSWAFVDLTSLGEVKSLQFTLNSSDTGIFGMNTPAYVCIDTIVPQPAIATFDDLELEPESYWNGADGSGGFVSGKAHFANQYDPEWDFWDGFAYSNITDANSMGYFAQYNAITGSGEGDSPNYAIAFVGWETPPTVTFAAAQPLGGLYVTNNCYAYYDMLYGSLFSKKFGGETGDDPDWFKLTITGIDPNDQPTGMVDFYLADFRSEDNAQDYILDSWAFVNLTSLGEVKSLQFTLSSSDTGMFGMNTPAYVCIDTITGWFVDEPAPPEEQIDPDLPQTQQSDDPDEPAGDLVCGGEA